MLLVPHTRQTGAFRGAPQWVSPALGALPTANGASMFTQTLSSTAPTGEAVAYSLASGTLPPGLSISGNTLSGALSNPSQDTTYNFILKATGQTYGTFSERPLSMTVARSNAADPFANQVLFLYHADTDYTDSSAKARTLAATNPSTSIGLSTANPKFGAGSLYFGGTTMAPTSDLRIPASNDLLITGDFTFEFWMNSFSTANGQTANMVMFVSASGPPSYTGSTEPTNVVAIFAQPGNGSLANKISVKFQTTGTTYAGSTIVNDSTWRHIALVRSGMGTNNIKLFQNGVQEATWTYTGTCDFGQQYGMKIGQWVGQQSNCFYKGYLDEIRLTTAARYSANFTPQTAAFPYP